MSKGEVGVGQVAGAREECSLAGLTIFTRARGEERTWNLEELKVQNGQNL